jgi:hypothetical protein
MAEGLAHAFNEISKNGKITVIANRVRLNPRVVLMTDGHPDSEEKVKRAVAVVATLGIPIACVGVKGCDQDLLKWIASTTGGMFTMADEMAELSAFFRKQVLLTLFIVQFAEDMKKLYSLEALRYFMEERTGRRLSDAELRALLVLIRSIASAEQEIPTSSSSRTPPAKTKPKQEGGKGSTLFIICSLLSSVAIPHLALRYWQAHTEGVDWLSGGVTGGLGWQGEEFIWGVLGLAVVTYLVSRWVYNWADRTWTMPLAGDEYVSAFVRAAVVFGIVGLLLFGWFSWPACLGYAASGAIGLMRKYGGSSW